MSILIKEHGDWNPNWENFKPTEFECQHCNELKISKDLVSLLQDARDHLGALQITSGYRCSEHNAAISKTGENGPHTTGLAVDIAVQNSQQRKELISFFAPVVSGLGIAKTFIHIDLLNEEDGFDPRPNCWLY